MNPRVSIIIPCYKQAHYLSDALESVLAQTHSNWECIIVNDGSPDDTGEVARGYASRDPRIRYLEQENRGLAGARNSGLAIATGEYIQFLDADDVILPEKLAAQLAVFSQEPRTSVVYCDFFYFEHTPDNRSDSPAAFKAKYGNNDIAAKLLGGNFVVVHAALVRRQDIQEAGGFDESLRACEDYDLWLRLAAQGKLFAYLDCALALYRITPGSMTRDMLRQVDATLTVLQKIPRYWNLSHSGLDAVLQDYMAELNAWRRDLMEKRECQQRRERTLVSICIPAYNGSRYMRQCLDSALAQTHAAIEVIVVDDQSNDDSYAIAREYAASDSRVNVFRNDRNLGLVGNWNRCVELAKGEWIKFLFQDDLLAPECVERMLAAANNHWLVACRREFLFEAGVDEGTQRMYRTLPTLEAAHPIITDIDERQFAQWVLLKFSANFVGEPTATMVRRDAFQRYGLFNAKLIQLCDFEYWARIGVNHGLAYVPESLAHFRVHAASTSSSNARNRTFRMDVLDPLLLMQEFACNPVYRPLREIARRMPQHLMLKKWLQGLALQARRRAEAARGTAEDHEWQEWRALAQDFPRLRATLPWVLEGAHRRYSRWIGWRFKGKGAPDLLAQDKETST